MLVGVSRWLSSARGDARTGRVAFARLSNKSLFREDDSCSIVFVAR